MARLEIKPDTPETHKAVFIATMQACGNEIKEKDIPRGELKFDYTEETSEPSIIVYLDDDFLFSAEYSKFKKIIKKNNPEIKMAY